MAYPFQTSTQTRSFEPWPISASSANEVEKNAGPARKRSWNIAPINRLVKRALNRQMRQAQASKLVFESLDPRLLFAADPFTAMMSDSQMTLSYDNASKELRLLDSTNTVVASKALADTSEVKVTGSFGDDVLTLDSSLGSAGANLVITFNGGEGDDQLTVNSALAMGSSDLSVSSENIVVTGSGSITTTGSLTLTAVDEDADQTDSSSSASASVTLQSGSELSAGALSISATANAGADSPASDTSWSTVTSTASAVIDLYGEIEADTLTISTSVTNQVTADVSATTNSRTRYFSFCFMTGSSCSAFMVLLWYKKKNILHLNNHIRYTNMNSMDWGLLQ
ncbi:MAG: hypothetical protein ACPGYX_01860, partial [Oceanobacter sp.]